MQPSTLPHSLSPAHVGGPTDPSHDERLRRGILLTDIQPSVARLLALAFVFAIFAVPLSQAYLEHREGEDSPLVDLFRRKPSTENLRQFEKDIEQGSYAKAYTQPRLQLFLTRYGRVGNKLALVGNQGYLYYQPGVLHVSDAGFLDHDLQKSREKDALDAGESALVADPRPAIFAFDSALRARGIRLILMPVPDKAALAGEPLHGRSLGTEPLHNPDWPRFLAELRQHGVAVFDASAGLTEKPDLFLAQDTHWTPEFMERVAQRLAAYVKREVALPAPATPSALHSVAQPQSRVGDLVDMLKLPEAQSLFLPQSVTVHQVQSSEGEAWEPDDQADVLLLGDSFTNIFSLEGMGWGAAAGLGPQLSLALARPLDVIAQNDSGAYATRQALLRALSSGEDRLQGKRVLIWEFASRELSVGDWKQLDWNAPHASGAAP